MNNIEKFKSLTTRYCNLNLSDYYVAVFGAGNTSALYKKCFDYETITDHITCFIDNGVSKQGMDFLDKKVVSLASFLSQTSKRPKLVLISSANINFCNSIKQQLNGQVDFLTIDEYVFNKRINEILAVLELLEDDFSKRVYTEMIIARMANQPFAEDIYTKDQYFCLPPFLDRNPNEVFVDLGAYVGDSIEQYIQCKSGVFSKIFAFEPDARNMDALQYRMERLCKEWSISKESIVCEKAGVGRRSECLSLYNSNTDSPSLGARIADAFDADAEQIQIYAIDDYFANQKVGFLKADIESFELDMLIDAKKTILRDSPILAISIYHNALDMWKIVLWLSELLPNYAFKIRQHSHLLLDTVLYAYPK